MRFPIDILSIPFPVVMLNLKVESIPCISVLQKLRYVVIDNQHHGASNFSEDYKMGALYPSTHLVAMGYVVRSFIVTSESEF